MHHVLHPQKRSRLKFSEAISDDNTNKLRLSDSILYLMFTGKKSPRYYYLCILVDCASKLKPGVELKTWSNGSPADVFSLLKQVPVFNIKCLPAGMNVVKLEMKGNLVK